MNESTEKYLQSVLDEASNGYDAIQNTAELSGRYVTMKLRDDVKNVMVEFLDKINTKNLPYRFTAYGGIVSDFINVTCWLNDEKAVEIVVHDDMEFYSIEAEWKVKTNPELMQLLSDIKELIEQLKYKSDTVTEPFEELSRGY